MRAWVYILLCADGRYYIGSHRGDDPAVRVGQHNDGIDPKAWTYKRRPVTLVWQSEFQWITDAIAFERQIKLWSRAKKEALIRNDWDALPALARAYSRREGQGSVSTPSSFDGRPFGPAQDEG